MLTPSLLISHAEPPVLAAVTTLHLAALLLIAHQHVQGIRGLHLLIPSLAFAVSPWLLPTTAAIAAGLLLHIGWTATVRRLPKPASPPASLSGGGRPSPANRGPATPAPRPQPSPAPRPGGFTQVPVIGVFPETPDITTFRMARPEGFDFKAGQFTSVRLKIDGRPVVRCYSISSAPEAGGYFEISVKRQGLMSGTLHASIRPGSMVSVMPPSGGFTYPDEDDRPLGLLAGGVGITPLMSMLRHATAADPTRPITLLYSTNTHSDIAFRDELRLLAHRHPQTRIVITNTRGPHADDCRSGRIDAAMITENVDDVRNTVFMICGPGPMIDGMKECLRGLGVPDDQIRSEAFEAAVASTVPIEDPGATTVDVPAETFQLRLLHSNATIQVGADETLLDACESAGVELPFACRAGVCGTCRSRVIDGTVRCDSDLLDDREREEGYTLPCVAWAESDCAMEA